MSLNDYWQQQRQQRQQEVMQRQQVICESLTATKQARQAKAAQLRYELSAFREALASESTTHRMELQQYCQRLHVETQAFLTAASDRRHAQAAQLAQELALFVQVLRQQASAFLTMAQSERAVAAQRLNQELVTFVDDLRSDVQSYLIELEAVRQQQTTQLNQALLQNRAKREIETQELFQHLAVFRTELRRFAQELHSSVWGGNEAPNIKATVAKPTPTLNGTKPISRVSVLPKASVTVAPAVGAFQHGNSVAVVPPVKVVKAPQKDAITYEKNVYEHIQKVHGARLTEIESALGLSRFQAVDALRSLIKQGLVTQRDRIYLSQAHLAHT
jgi:hypothetical protein